MNTQTVRRTNKDIPISPGEWFNEVQGCESLIARIETTPTTKGILWVRNMKQYYVDRLADLLENQPPALRQFINIEIAKRKRRGGRTA
jgi:hypothetical protein